VVFPEASLFGYYPGDLLERPEIVEQQLFELELLHRELPEGISCLVGAITKTHKKKGRAYYNSAVLLEKNRKARIFNKELLPVYDVFDEGRHIETGDLRKNFFTLKGKRFLVTICEDIWAWGHLTGTASYSHNPLTRLRDEKCDVVLNLSGSPYYLGKPKARHEVTQQTARYMNAPVVYVNMVGGQDELIFDGGSFVIDKAGAILAQAIYFDEDLIVYDLEESEGELRDNEFVDCESLRRALALGIRDFVEKSGLSRVHLGLSGGVDSALVACLAVDALGPHKVTVIGLPGPFSSPDSLKYAKQLADNLGVEWKDLGITSAYDVCLRDLSKLMTLDEFGVVQENLQARLRGVFLMAFANSSNSLLLTTGNKAEYAVGYSTLYGDMCGGLAPIADLHKTQVWDLARHYNHEYPLIPEFIIQRLPSAELKPGQVDQDFLPEYAELDQSVKKLVEHYGSASTPVDQWVLQRMLKTEFKRWQAPPILRVSQHAFGRGRRLPIAHGYQAKKAGLTAWVGARSVGNVAPDAQ
jgi:NAD+ synthase (glutamine-hydrolysing)